MIGKWEKSREYLERAKKSLAGGVSSPFRVKAPVPLYFRNGCGARLEDADGNEYIDYVLAWGPMILGYRHPAIVEAMRVVWGRTKQLIEPSAAAAFAAARASGLDGARVGVICSGGNVDLDALPW